MEPGFRVGEWQVQPDLGTLTRGEEQFQLEPKVIGVLVYLARHPGDVLPKEKIIRAVWPDTFVTDEVLTNAISELRKAFGDDAKNPTIIQTLPRRGYRLIAPVTGMGRSQEPERAAKPGIKTRWQNPVALAIAGAVVVIIAGLLIWQVVPADPPAEGPIDSIAVLPFRNDTGDSDADYLCSEIPASLSAKLSELRELRVIPTSNLGRFRDQEIEAPAAASQLRVRAVLQGRVLQVGEQLSIGVELVDGVQNRVLWGRKYNRPFRDVFQIEEEIVSEVTSGLRLRLDQENPRRRRQPTEDTEAYEDYLKAKSLLDQLFPKPEAAVAAVQRAKLYYQRAIEKDPNFALAYVGLSGVHRSLGLRTQSPQLLAKSKHFAEKALTVDSTCPEAHLRMAYTLSDDRDWKGAISQFEAARRLKHDIFSYILLVWMGRLDEALQVVETQEKISDPLSNGQTLGLGYGYYWCRQYDRALEKALKSGDPWLETLSYQALGRDEEAFAAAMRNALSNGRPPEEQQEYREAFRGEGLKGFWRVWAKAYSALLEESSDGRPTYVNLIYDIAGAHAFAGEKEMAFKWLSRACELPNLMSFVTDARFDSLRDDPRYEQLQRKLNLPEEAIARHLIADY